jgi:hypothetical protein
MDGEGSDLIAGSKFEKDIDQQGSDKHSNHKPALYLKQGID